MSVFVLNFQAPKSIDELIWFYKHYRHTNIDVLIEEDNQNIIWTVPSNSEYGDTVVFACARTAINHMAHVCVQVKTIENKEICVFAEEQRLKYKKYSGRIIGIGKIGEEPYPDDSFGQRAYSSKIVELRLLKHPIDLSEFKGIINLSRFCAHTRLDRLQWEQLKKRMENDTSHSDIQMNIFDLLK